MGAPLRRAAPAIALAAAAAALLSCGPPPPLSRSEPWLGTSCTITVYDRSGRGLLEKAFARIAGIDARMGLDRSGSEVDAINAAAGGAAVRVSPDTLEVIASSVRTSRLTGGAFDVSVGPLVELWGIGRGPGRVPSPPEIARARALCGYERIELDPGSSTVRLRDTGMRLDLGGIAKGHAGDEAAAVLAAGGAKSAIVDLGGNIVALGSRPNGGRWRIGVQDPQKSRGEYLGIVEVTDRAVVTSGVYERYFEKDGVRYHHILDPATGAPARSGLLGVSIVARRSTEADALSTGVFVLGLERGLALVESLPGVEAVFVTEDRKVIASSGLAPSFRLTSPAYTLVETPPR